MSLIPHSLLPRSMFDMDLWHRPLNTGFGFGTTTMDLFDPFDNLDRVMGRNLFWIDKPDYFLRETLPVVPRKHRIVIDCAGYNPQSIKTEIKKDDKGEHSLVVAGKEGNKDSEHEFSVREFKKTFKLPADCETEKMASFFTSNSKLVIELPLREKENSQDDLFPAIVSDESSGNKDGKLVKLNMSIPKDIDPSKIKVTCKDRDIIISGEKSNVSEDGSSQVYFYRRTTLPENTDFNSLKCVFDNNKLSLTAPLIYDYSRLVKTIPIESSKTCQNCQNCDNKSK